MRMRQGSLKMTQEFLPILVGQQRQVEALAVAVWLERPTLRYKLTRLRHSNNNINNNERMLLTRRLLSCINSPSWPYHHLSPRLSARPPPHRSSRLSLVAGIHPPPIRAMSSASSQGGFVSLTNRCNDSKSPYVRSHANNPTAWQLWSPETLDLARRTNRLLFVSIGYSACHWCHVMAHESFMDNRIAQLLNEHFIPVKVDREERPDVDKVYMDFLQATTGGGGWPLNVFVTPDLQPLFGGTYWPGPHSERAHVGGFEAILTKVAGAWKEQESRCRESAASITEQLKQFAQEGTLSGRKSGEGLDERDDGLELELLEEAYDYYSQRYDEKHAGFGSAPKFPTPSHLSFLLRLGEWDGIVSDVIGDDAVQNSQKMVVKTLENMALGGIKDQVGNGFARYSVTRDWSLPHFEKMYVGCSAMTCTC
jgi:uncharacterized protein YyaL (SSP411 family)